MSKRETRREANAKVDREQERLNRLGDNQMRRGERTENKTYLYQNRKVNEALRDPNVSWWKKF